MERREAYRSIHRPADMKQAQRARRRIIYDELMLMQLGLGISRRLREGRISAPVLRIDKLLDQRIRARFPFPLTNAQQNARSGKSPAIFTAAASPNERRLLQGDVGSGKTVVAIYAMLLAVRRTRLQSAMSSRPTEVLAEQHYLTLSRALAGSNVVIELFTGRIKAKEAARRRKDLANGKIHVAVGTQALIQETIEFANLGLVVVDEQHKLGVKQRGVLKGKGLSPHYLVMTATPIPRTLALSYFADFAYSQIDELPPGRQPIVTRWLRAAQAASAYDFIRKEVQAGRQAYIVVPQIDDNGLEETKSVMKEYDRLSKGPLSTLRLAVLHGQMKTEQKAGNHDRLPASSQIDVLRSHDGDRSARHRLSPTAHGDADRQRRKRLCSLSQLHQLPRPRRPRQPETSYCILISDPPNETTETLSCAR